MGLQTGKNIELSYLEEVDFNVPVSGAGARQIRANPSPGLNLARAEYENMEIRSDGQSDLPRMGSESVTGSFESHMSVGTHDPLYEAVLRGEWVAPVAITQATATSITVTANTIVRAAGSWITDGARVGDVGRLAGQAQAGNNGRNIAITSVSALTLGVAPTDGSPLIVDASPDTTFTFTLARKLAMGASPVRRSFTFEDHKKDLAVPASLLSSGVRVSSVKFTGTPDANASVDFGYVGASQSIVTGGSSPNFTNPVLTDSKPLSWVDAKIYIDGVAVANLTGFEFTLDMNAKGEPVIGSVTTPDVFEENTKGTGQLTSLMLNFDRMTEFKAETEFSFFALLAEPESEPKDFISIYLPRCKYTGATQPVGGEGAAKVTLPFRIGSKGVATGFDRSMITMLTSAAA